LALCVAGAQPPAHSKLFSVECWHCVLQVHSRRHIASCLKASHFLSLIWTVRHLVRHLRHSTEVLTVFHWCCLLAVGLSAGHCCVHCCYIALLLWQMSACWMAPMQSWIYRALTSVILEPVVVIVMIALEATHLRSLYGDQWLSGMIIVIIFLV